MTNPTTDPWIKSSDRMPESGKKVFAYYKNSHGHGRRIRAYYAAPMTEECSSDSDLDFGIYDEAKDQYYLPEGWYESNEHEDTNWSVDEPVTHWMPLPEPPNE